ncbi:replication termination factor 2 [Episyrphus balteatus]|uniref:replication termination factor 2 n=1 Tax=Episyrphus balteatus TaxID=286459 RepID=UPI0024862532|nr:replication termination factor 2 [Episyrphus balteatus]
MGCDGGTIPRRDELVRLKKKAEQKDKDAERQFRWLHCALTQQRLQEPIVMCTLGRLYSKQNVIEQLLEKDKMPESSNHIKGMRDIKDLHLTNNPAFKDCNKTEGGLDPRGSPYICKLMGIEMSGNFRFVALWTCGCAFSERALKQIKTNTCPLCQVPYSIEDVIVLNGNEEDIELMKLKVQIRAARKKASKKSKSKNSKPTETATTTTVVSETIDEGKGLEAEPTKPAEDEPSTETTPTLSTQGTEEPACSGANKAPKNGFYSTSKRNGAKTLEDPEIKRLKNDYSVAHDPKATNVYKSLFTSHKSEQEQNRAHWVTYNPFYN